MWCSSPNTGARLSMADCESIWGTFSGDWPSRNRAELKRDPQIESFAYDDLDFAKICGVAIGRTIGSHVSRRYARRRVTLGPDSALLSACAGCRFFAARPGFEGAWWPIAECGAHREPVIWRQRRRQRSSGHHTRRPVTHQLILKSS